MLGFLLIILVVAVFAIIGALKPRVMREYERGVIFRLGRFTTVAGPGIVFVLFYRGLEKVDMRVITMDVPDQDIISQDNVSVKVNAVIYCYVVDPRKAINNVKEYYEATSQLAQTTLRSVLGKHTLDEMLSERDKLNGDIRDILDEETDQWGIKVTNVEIKHVDLDESMVRAIAQEAEAERERRAKRIHASGELEAAQNLTEAAQQLGKDPQAMQLRYLQTLSDISQENAKTIVFPVPTSMMNQFPDLVQKMTENDDSQSSY
ncbi:MAG: hypothetical protein BRC23_01985 [Parcubacteria group bacterium SW_4_49_11]|nr:MAG: hypothetical protein BRC23_01985 [Parcubacteria group bacterium SW_4_49_11]